ncbi:MAG: T9SS type A sorting domain-containing protein [bacterium]|nr:T9SS type A sorting domain-containing protein [bacterium]
MTVLPLKKVNHYTTFVFLVIILLTGNLFSQTYTPKYPSGEVCTDGLDVLKSTGAQYSENISLAGRWAEGPCQAVDIEGNILCFGNGGMIEIADITDPANPAILSNILINGEIRDIDISGNYIFAGRGSGGGMVIVDITSPESPVIVGSCIENSSVWEVEVVGEYAYAADYSAGLKVIDISDPNDPVMVSEWDAGSTTPSGKAQGVSVSGNYAYMACGSWGIYTIDISDPLNLIQVSRFDPQYFKSHDVCVSGNYAYVAECYYGMSILDISDPANPIRVFSSKDADFGAHGWEVIVSENVAYLYDYSFGGGLTILDISDHVNPVVLGSFETGDCRYKLCFSGDHIYATAGSEGLEIFDVSDPAEPVEKYHFPTAGISEDIEVSDGVAFVANHKGGLRIIDFDDPANPVEIAKMDMGRVDEISLSGDLLCASDGGSNSITEGLNFVDVSDPANPLLRGSFEIEHFCTDIKMKGNYIYATFPETFLMLDISDPESPSQVSRITEEDTWFWGADISGNYAYVVFTQLFEAENFRGMRVIDISQPSNPVEIGNYFMNSDPRAISVSGDYAYVCCDSGLHIIDVSIPSNPTETGMLCSQYAEDVFIAGPYAYIAASSNGLRLIDISTPAEPFEAGYYNTGYSATKVFVNEEKIYVADYNDGIYVLQNDLYEPETNGQIARNFRLYENYPNPFNPETTIKIKLLIESNVSLKIYDITGREVRKLTSGRYPIGTHYLKWDGTNDSGFKVSSGVYIYRLKAGKFSQTKKMLLIK